MAQKARKEVEEKAWEEAERQRIAEEEEDGGVPPIALRRGARERSHPTRRG